MEKRIIQVEDKVPAKLLISKSEDICWICIHDSALQEVYKTKRRDEKTG